MDKEFSDKVILVTGGTGSLGNSKDRMFNKRNPKVLVISHRSDSEKSRIVNLLNEGAEALSQKRDTIMILSMLTW